MSTNTSNCFVDTNQDRRITERRVSPAVGEFAILEYARLKAVHAELVEKIDSLAFGNLKAQHAGSVRIRALETALQAMLDEHDILSRVHPSVAEPNAQDRWPNAAKLARAALARAVP